MNPEDYWGEPIEDPIEAKKRENAEHYKVLAEKHGLSDAEADIPETISMEDPVVRGLTSKEDFGLDDKSDRERGAEMRKEQKTLRKQDRAPIREEKRNL